MSETRAFGLGIDSAFPVFGGRGYANRAAELGSAAAGAGGKRS